MGKTKTSGKGRLDKYYYLAKEQGYRSRAAFKLVQLNRKYQFLEKAHTLLDLCAAPGGWLQVAVKYMPVASLVVGVDLVPIRAIRGCTTLTEDITTPKCRAELKKLLKGGAVDVVLHDGSPNVGGAWAKEALSQLALTLDSLKLACEFLRPGGIFVTKVFRSQDYHALIHSFKQFFKKVEATKPMASRSTSAEIYVICMGYKAPAKFDHKLLEVKHVFKETIEPPKVVDVLADSKRKRHREGYEEGVSLLHKKSSVAEFVASTKPVEFLGTFQAIEFVGPQAAAYLQHEATDREVLASCEDLRVLGKSEFKSLLKWRMKIKKAFPVGGKGEGEDEEMDAGEGGKGEEKEEEEEEEEDEEKGVLDEMQEMKTALDAKKKRQQRNVKKRKEKAKTRAATGGMAEDALGDVYGDDDLFNLKAIKSSKQLAKLEPRTTVNGVSSEESDDEISGSDENEEVNGSDLEEEEEDSDLDTDLQRLQYEKQMEEYFDSAYEEYRNATDGSSKRRTRARLQGDKGKESEGELWEEAEKEDNPAMGESGGRVEEEENPLIVDLSAKLDPVTAKKKLTSQWFSQDLFEGFSGGEKHEVGSEVVEIGSAGLEDKAQKSTSKTVLNAADREAAALSKHNKVRRASEQQSKQNDLDDTSTGFEVVPQNDISSSDEEEGGGRRQSDTSSSGEDSLDGYATDEKAETLAYARKMLRKKDRDEILDSAYNKYTFNDDVLPKWFEDDQKRFYRTLQPITKEEVQAMKEQNRALNARPVKKVAEAKARKRRVMLKKMEVVRQKATAISDQPDLNTRAKNKLMERLYKKAERSKKGDRKKEVVVAGKGSQGNRGKGAKGKLMVDRRMIADKRGLERSKQRKGSRGKGGPKKSGPKRK